MLRMMTSDFITHSQYKLRHVILTYVLALTEKLKAIYGPCLISFHGSPEDREDVEPSFSLGTDGKKLPGVLWYKKRVVQG